jgi:UDP-glucose 4-epimerase
MEVLRAVEEVTGRTVPFEMGPRRAGDAPALVANSDKLKRALGWKPRFPELPDIVTTAWQFEKNRRKSETAVPFHFRISHTSET